MERVPQDSLKRVDHLLGDQPNYEETQLNVYSGTERIYPTGAALNERLQQTWWVKVMESPAAQRVLEGYLRAKYVSLLAEGDHKATALTSARDLATQFKSAVSKRGDGDGSPQAQVEALKADTSLSVDEAGQKIYDAKAEIDSDTPGYGSFQWGLTPEKTAELLEITPQELVQQTVLIAGVGTGDIARYSLPQDVNVFGVDLSPRMAEVATKRGVPSTALNVSNEMELSTLPDSHKRPNIVIADYFLDVTDTPVTALKNLTALLPDNGRLVITVLLPITQAGADSRKVGDATTLMETRVTDEQNIGNTGNPWSDAKKLANVAATLGLQLKRFSITSYVQYDSGRKEEPLPGEIRPSGIFIFEKVSQ